MREKAMQQKVELDFESAFINLYATYGIASQFLHISQDLFLGFQVLRFSESLLKFT